MKKYLAPVLLLASLPVQAWDQYNYPSRYEQMQQQQQLQQIQLQQSQMIRMMKEQQEQRQRPQTTYRYIDRDGNPTNADGTYDDSMQLQ